jgi:hypothetical protein
MLNVLSATAQNLVERATILPEFAHSWPTQQGFSDQP